MEPLTDGGFKTASGDVHRFTPRIWRSLACPVIVSAYLTLCLAYSLSPGGYPQPEYHWQDKLSAAERALKDGDSVSARSFYSQAGRIASWNHDWRGTLAAACGMKRLDDKNKSYFATRATLIRAMIAAETMQSRSGLKTVAEAFESIDEQKAAEMVRGISVTSAEHEEVSLPQFPSWNCG